MKIVDFLYRPIKDKYGSRNDTKIKYIVVHDTGNRGHGADGMAHYRFLSRLGGRPASAHYFVDDKKIVQTVGDSLSAWHCGDGKGRYGITNSNSIGVEMCINRNGNYEQAFNNTVELVKNLMIKFNVSVNRVVRHYDASRKSCPNSWRDNNWERWRKFQLLIKEPIKIKLDLSKDSVGVPVNKLIEPQGKVRVDYKGKIIDVDGKLEKGTNYVAVRDIFEKLGYRVDWENNMVIIR